MRTRPRRLAAIALPLLAAAALAAGPATGADAGAERARRLAAAREVIAGAGYATLVTNGEDGRPQARIVDPFPPDDDFTVWLATKPTTRKVTQIRRDPRVTLLWFDPAALAYVTLHGDAEPVDDPEEKATRWKPTWAGFYADENRGDDYLLIRIRARRLEVVSPGHDVVGDDATWRPPEVELGDASD